MPGGPIGASSGCILLPVLMGMLSKPPALVFPVILFAFVYLFESRNVKTALRAVAPALVASGIMAIILHSMTAARFDAGGNSPALYRITQTYVALHYFWSFFLPTQLSADSEWRLLTGATDPRAIVGFLFLVGVCIVIWFAQRRTETRPIAFGLIWFVAALFPRLGCRSGKSRTITGCFSIRRSDSFGSLDCLAVALSVDWIAHNRRRFGYRGFSASHCGSKGHLRPKRGLAQ